MKLIVRADDFGYTKAYNDGTIEAIDNGIVTSVDIMFDTPGAIDALIRIRDYPWISIGWHAHFWGKPVLDPSLVPSMIDESGKFKFRKDQKLKSTCKYEEVLMESRAQMELCLKILGRVPDTAWIQDNGSEFERARKQVCEEYGIQMNIASKPDYKGVVVPSYDRYKHLNIYMPNQPATVYKICYSNDYSERMSYDPIKYYTNDEGDILNKEIALTAWHPGYLDPYIMSESSLAEGRVIDVKALCSDELKRWIVENKIELVNHRDAIYGTNEYQNHLRSANSPLLMR